MRVFRSLSLLGMLFCLLLAKTLSAEPISEAFPVGGFLPSNALGWNQGSTFNSKNNEYLVVWSQETDGGAPFVYAQRIAGDTGSFLGDRIVVSSDIFTYAYHPTVAYNSLTNEYLVLWSGNYQELSGSEVFLQRINAETGEKILGNRRISDVGFEDDPERPGRGLEVRDPAVVYNPKENQYLVVWWGTEAYRKNTVEPAEYYIEWEIYGQLLDGDTATEIGANDFRISVHGSAGETGIIAKFPSLAYNDQEGTYLVVWVLSDYVNKTDNTQGVYGRRFDAKTGKFVAIQERLDTPGFRYPPEIAPAYVAYNSRNNQFLVTWAQSDTGPDPDSNRGEEIFSQRFDGKSFGKLGSRVQISKTGISDDSQFDAYFPLVAYNPFRHQYVVVWDADPSGGKHFITGQVVDADSGARVRSVDFLLSSTPALTAIPGLGTHIEPTLILNTNSEGGIITFLGWDTAHDSIGVWGQLVGSSDLDNMNTEPTPTPAPTATTPPPPNGAASGDVKAYLQKVKGKNSDYLAFCGYEGTGTVSYTLGIYRSANNKLEFGSDQMIMSRSGELNSETVAPVKFTAKAKKRGKPQFLIAACQLSQPHMIDLVPTNNVKRKKLKS